MKRFLKIIILSAAILLALLLIFGTAVGIQYYRVSHSGAKVEMLSDLSLPDGIEKLTLGEKYRLTAEFKVPWGIRPSAAEAEISQGCQLTAEPESRRSKIKWGYTLWKTNVRIQAFREGAIKANRGQVSFSNGQTINLKIPSFEVVPPVVKDNQLELADQLVPQKTVGNNRSLYLWVLCGFVLLCLVIWFVIRFIMRPKTHLLTPWEKAMEAIHALLDSVNTGKMTPELSVVKLTDIVREYLERRFSLRAEHQTTVEFLNDLEHTKNCLTEEQSCFLRDFLTVADMVKFAKAAADRTLIEKVAAHAETLVKETIPAESAKENKK